MQNTRRRASACFTAAAVSLIFAASAMAQSINRGEIDGVVFDTAGAGFYRAYVTITHRPTGTQWHLTTNKRGRFRQPLLPPGEYDVFVEEIGFQPVRVGDIIIHPRRRQTIQVTLRPVQLPVNEVEALPYTRAIEDSRAGESQWFAPLEIDQLPDDRREVTQLGRYSSVSNEELDTQQLPGWLTGLAFDGILYAPARNYDLPTGVLGAEAFPLSNFAGVELFTDVADVEYSEYAGAYLSGYTRQGTERPQVRFYGDFTGGNVTSSEYFDGSSTNSNSLRGGAVVSGPVVTDTAHYVLGFEAQRLETPLPPAWANSALNPALIAVADSFGVDLRPYTQPRVQTSDLFSAYGRFDWQITQNHAVSVRGSLASLDLGGRDDRLYDPGLGPNHIASLGSKLDGLDASGGATLASRLGNVVSNEFRVGAARSDRAYSLASPPATRIVDGGAAFGMDPALPADFKRFAIRGSNTTHLALGNHRLKAGIGAVYTSYEQRYTNGLGGEFAFGTVGEFANLQGSFQQATGDLPFARFRNRQLALYIQDVWNVAPGLEVLLGFRYEHERLDSTNLVLNAEWLDLTGIDNTAFDKKIDKYSPRFGFRWDISQRGEWLVRGTAGIYHNLVPAGVQGEAMTQYGAIDSRSGIGNLSSWPDAPDAASAPTVGPRLTVLGPQFGPPRTGRVSVGLSRLFGDRTAVHLSGNYRYTDFIPVRQDINLALAPSGQDQYGRPVYGSLTKEGSVLAVEPHTNRRFPNFSLVSAIDASGVSKYWGGTVAVEHKAGEWLDLLAAYTFSWGEDNWLGPNGGGPAVQLNPFPGSPLGFDWAQGPSDFDVPHRLVIGAEAKFSGLLAGARVGGFYRFQSGQPYTPGFRAGVDANGDGSNRNDPAYIDPGVEGIDQLLSQWSCLASQANRFAGRNSCRGPSLYRLDLRFALGLYAVGGTPIELVIDALNIFDTDTGIRDNAVYLIDANAPLETAPDATLIVPLVANPNFGKALVHYSTGRTLRVGLRMGL